jgi:hypothetical protein
MRRYSALLIPLFFLVVGCSSDKQKTSETPPPPEQIRALSTLDKEQIAAFGKDLFNIDEISAKAMTLVGNEIKQVIMGEKEAVDAVSLLDAAKIEAGKSLDTMLKKAVPAELPPWFTQNLVEAKKGFADAYSAKIASFDAIRRFMDEKNPAMLIEYKQKAALADKSFRDAREKLAAVLNVSGIQTKDAAPASGKTEN